MGRRTTFNPEIGAKICDLLAEGYSLLAISKLPGMKPITTLQGWAWNADWSSEAFVVNYTRARALQAHSEFDGLKEVEGELKVGKIDPHTARVLIDSIKWRLSKMLPRVYGDRTHIEHSGEVKTTPKDFAPEWMVERLTGKGTEAPTASDEGEETIIH